MFIVHLTYKKPLETVEEFLVEHRNFLEEGYKKNFFIASGPKIPRTGGIILSQLKDRDQLQNILAADPFLVHDIADYEIVEFDPVKYHQDFASFIQ